MATQPNSMSAQSTALFKMAPREKKDAGAAKKAAKHNHCPYGCKYGNGEDENGYCRHLLGWIANGSKSVTVRVLKHLGNPEHCNATENVEVDGDTVKKTDRVVPMLGTFSRVYRYDADAPFGAELPDQPPLPPDALTLEQLEDEARDKELAGLKDKLAERDEAIAAMQAQHAKDLADIKAMLAGRATG